MRWSRLEDASRPLTNRETTPPLNSRKPAGRVRELRADGPGRLAPVNPELPRRVPSETMPKAATPVSDVDERRSIVRF